MPNDARFLDSRDSDPDAVHPLEATPVELEGEHVGIPGGTTEAHDKAETERVKNLPEVGGESPLYEFAPTDIEVEEDFKGTKAVPRHDRYADENSPFPTPDRVIPSTPTNANPSYADYAVPTQDRPGFADGTDAVNVAEALGEDVEADEDGNVEVAEPEVTYEVPEIVKAGEGGWVTRDPDEDATGATSPIGDEHNDPEDNRIADTKAEADAITGPGEDEAAAVEASKGEQDPAPVMGYQDGEEEGSTVAVPMPEAEDGPPARSALKSDWVTYVSENFEVSEDDAEAMTKDQLIETYGS